MISVAFQAWRRCLLLTRAALGLLLVIPPCPARADGDDALAAVAVAGEIAHKQKMRQLFPDFVRGAQATPPVIPQLELDADPSGMIATYQPNGATRTATSPFFQNLGTNGRTCFTCHQPEDGWGLSAQHAQDRFAEDPTDPLFRLVDGATCPSDDVSTLDAMRKAYSLVISKGLIRIGLPMQSSMHFQIIGVQDPYGCNTNPATGLTGAQIGTASFYRRPLPTANLGFLSTIMWDGREATLFQQSVDATLTHAQGSVSPSATQQQEIVSFEGCTTAFTPGPCANTPAGIGVFTAQHFDGSAGYLGADSATGGPVILSQQVDNFSICENDPLGLIPGVNPCPLSFSPVIFTLYEAWANLTGSGKTVAARSAIARGEEVFNSVPINITGVAGINDVLGVPSVPGFCGTCHDTPNAGNHSVKAPLNIGVTNAGDPQSFTPAPPALDIAELPVFTVLCTAPDPLAGTTFQVTDIGRAMISGKCADIGKTKGPILRGLAARAPYFHNGSGTTLETVVDFYDQRFGIGFTEQQKTDLVAFLNSL
jgi:cytochrome c peroxidase